MGFFSELRDAVNNLHDATKWIDPIGHYSLDAAHDTSTDLVNETSRGIENLFGKDTFVGGLGEHWKNMSQKDKEDFGRWASNTGLSAAAIYGGMSAAGAGGGAGGAGSGAGAGAGGAADAYMGGAAAAGGGGGGAAAGAGGAAGGALDAYMGGAAGSGGGGVGGAAGAGAGSYLEAGGGVVTAGADGGLTWTGGAAGSGGVGPGGVGAATGGGMSGYSQYIPAATQGLNALLGAYQSKKAADALLASGDAANATQRYMFDTLNAQQTPYRTTGYSALDRYNALMRDPSSVVNDPGYEWQRQQGQQGIERSAAARGLGLSGAALKEASRYNTNFATTKYNDILNRNLTAAGLGQVANGQTAQAGMNYANNVSNTQLGMGNALAANYLNQGNIYGNALNQLGAYYSRPGG